jgi:CRISPR-associated protein Csb2
MPLARFDKGREQTTMVLDTWAQIDEGSIGVHWDVSLTIEEKEVLADVVREVGYLGRSESWVEGTLPAAFKLDEFDVRPGEARDRPGSGWEQVALLALIPAHEYVSWRERVVQSALLEIPQVGSKGKPLSKAQRARGTLKVQESHPLDLIGCLRVETAWLHELGWNQPPGTRKVFYWRRSNSLEASAPRTLPRMVRPAPVEFMLLSLATPRGNLHALPPVTRTLPQGELLHQALLSRSSEGAPPVVLSGRSPDGKPLRGEQGHRHAHLLHLDLDRDGHLDHALVWAPMGLDAVAQRSIRAVRRTFAKGTDPLSVGVAVAGSRQDLLSLPSPWGDELSRLLGGTIGSRHWRSVTPLVPPRFLKTRGANALEGQVARELSARGMPEPRSIRVVDPHADEDVRKSRHFVRRRGRRAAPPPPLDVGFVLELDFETAIRGPLVLGYASHFGLGLFGSTEE